MNIKNIPIYVSSNRLQADFVFWPISLLVVAHLHDKVENGLSVVELFFSFVLEAGHASNQRETSQPVVLYKTFWNWNYTTSVRCQSTLIHTCICTCATGSAHPYWGRPLDPASQLEASATCSGVWAGVRCSQEETWSTTTRTLPPSSARDPRSPICMTTQCTCRFRLVPNHKLNVLMSTNFPAGEHFEASQSLRSMTSFRIGSNSLSWKTSANAFSLTVLSTSLQEPHLAEILKHETWIYKRNL